MRSITLVIIWLFAAISISTVAQPRLAFTDLVNGPAQGLGDGLGQGAIITVWGYQLGDTPGQVTVTDSAGVTRPAAYVYYWKKADGQLPGGPANLYRSHQLYEVAFSLPTSALGSAQIQLQTANGENSNALPFAVINGRIFHVKTGGNNSNSGSFSAPWQYINGDASGVKAPGNGGLVAGDVVYSHGTLEKLDYVNGVLNGRAGVFLRSLNGRADAHIALVSYPGTQAKVESPSWGIHPYVSTGIVISKYDIRGGIIDEDPLSTSYVPPGSTSTAQITASAYGRIVGNFLGELAGKCSNGWAGAIVASEAQTDQLMVHGNEIADIGCNQTSHFHHTTYFTRRTQTGAAATQAGEFSWNYLHDNKAKYGIHYYDQTNDSSKACDQVTGTLKIHDNYIVNQRSVGISVQTSSSYAAAPCWTMDTEIYQNVLINTGLGPIAELNNGTQPYAMYLGGAIAGNFKLYNNLIDGVSDEASRKYQTPAVLAFITTRNSELSLYNNVIQPRYAMPLTTNAATIPSSMQFNLLSTDVTLRFSQAFLQRLTASTALNYQTDPQITSNGTVIIAPTSPAIGKGQRNTEVDFYGRTVSSDNPEIGPVRYEP